MTIPAVGHGIPFFYQTEKIMSMQTSFDFVDRTGDLFAMNAIASASAARSACSFRRAAQAQAEQHVNAILAMAEKASAEYPDAMLVAAEAEKPEEVVVAKAPVEPGVINGVVRFIPLNGAPAIAEPPFSIAADHKAARNKGGNNSNN